MNVIDSLKELFGGARSAIAKLRQSVDSINQKIAALQKERAEVLSLPAPWSEIQANIKGIVKGLRTDWIAKHGADAVRRLGGRAAEDMGPGREEIVPGRIPEPLAGLLTIEGLAALAPELVEDGLVHLLGAVEFTEGSPMASRFARIKAIDQEVRGLELELAKIADEAEAAGITGIPLPASVRGERVRVRQRLERWDTDRRMNAKTYERHPELAPPRPE